MMTLSLWKVSQLLSAVALASAQVPLNWNTTDFLFVFGDSYTTDGYNVSAGVNSPDPGYVSAKSLELYIHSLQAMSGLDVIQWIELGRIPG